MTELTDTKYIGDVFIVYSDSDFQIVERTIYPKLKDCGFKVYYDNDFGSGKSVFENISDAVNKCRKTLVYLTQASLQSTWCKFELMTALETLQKTNPHSVVLLLEGISKKQISSLTFLRVAPCVEISSMRESWIDDLTIKLRADISVGDLLVLLPAGNVGPGQAYSHFHGYLQYILPDLENKIISCDWYKGNSTKMPIMVFEMIPDSCICPNNVSETDPEHIKYVGDLEDIVYRRAGNYRVIKLPVYSVTDSDGTVYYCVAEYPSVIRAMFLMDKNHLATTTDVERRLQLVRFYFTMNEILHHSKQTIPRLAKLVLFNDAEETPRNVLLRAIKTELVTKNDSKNPLSKQTVTDPLSRLSSGIQISQDDREFKNVFIASPCSTDSTMCLQIKDRFETLEYRCTTTVNNSKRTIVESINQGLQNCRWFILICSEEVLKTGWLTLECLMAIQQNVRDHNMCLLMFLKNVQYSKVPDTLSWITLIQANGNYLQKIENTLADRPVELETMLPGGDVSDGLAWTYVANYLAFILEGLPEKIKEEFANESYVCYDKLIVLLPKSCVCYQSVEDADKRIKKHKHIVVTVDCDIEGMEGRSYHTDAYRMKNCFVGQFAAPIQCLHEMYESGVTELTKQDMINEANDFYIKTQTILQSTGLSERCSLLFYDDQVRQVADVITEEIERSVTSTPV